MVKADLPGLVIFDCDGVLVDSEHVSNDLLIENLARYGLTITEADFKSRFIGSTMASVGDTARSMGADLPDNWVEDLYAEMFARLRMGVDAIAGIEGVLDRLETENIPYCVASNGPEEKMDITLGATGLTDRFEGRRFSAHTVGIAKPDPGLFLHAAKAMGVAPANCVVIEDSATGAKAAAAAGMRCFGYAADTVPEKLQAENAVTFTDMKQLPALLGLSQS